MGRPRTREDVMLHHPELTARLAREADRDRHASAIRARRRRTARPTTGTEAATARGAQVAAAARVRAQG
jgi:hypothetical protein